MVSSKHITSRIGCSADLQPPSSRHKKSFGLVLSLFALLSGQAMAANLAKPSTYTAHSPSWGDTYTKAFDGINRTQAKATDRFGWLEFDFERQHSDFTIKFLEDNTYPYAVSQWKVQAWKGGEWRDVSDWQAHDSTTFNPAYPIESDYRTRRMRIQFVAPENKKVGFKELKITGSPVEATTPVEPETPSPIAFEDSRFYSEPTRFSRRVNLVGDYGVNNTDRRDDTGRLQNAIDELSDLENGGLIFIPVGEYYLMGVQMRSNVHLVVASGATIFPAAHTGSGNPRIFEFGPKGEPKVEYASITGQGDGFTVDFRRSSTTDLAVFQLEEVDNFKISNLNIEDTKTIFASILVAATDKGRSGEERVVWPHNGIIEKVHQSNSLFGYGAIQTYGADNILFREISSEGGVALRMETDSHVMKESGQGGIRDIFAEDISCTDGLTAVMFSPHFMENGSVQVNGVESNGCSFAVRAESGFVEVFSPNDRRFTRQAWLTHIRADERLGSGCDGETYTRGQNRDRWATRVLNTAQCLRRAERVYDLTPGTFEESNVFNVTVNYGTNAHLKQSYLDLFNLSNPDCDNVCFPTAEQWDRRGQVFIGPSIGGVLDHNINGGHSHYDVNIYNLNMNGFPRRHHVTVDGATEGVRNTCRLNELPDCPARRW